MLYDLLKSSKIALILLLIFTVITGLIYPLFITMVAQIIFPIKANGSLIIKNHKIIGSELLGQEFKNPKYFWGRVSLTDNYPYNTMFSGGSNLGPNSLQLKLNIRSSVIKIKQADLNNNLPIPIELVTASSSGLDPHISPTAALYQISRIAKLRNMPESNLKKLIDQFTEKSQFGLFGGPKINVLKINIALDEYE